LFLRRWKQEVILSRVGSGERKEGKGRRAN